MSYSVMIFIRNAAGRIKRIHYFEQVDCVGGKKVIIRPIEKLSNEQVWTVEQGRLEQHRGLRRCDPYLKYFEWFDEKIVGQNIEDLIDKIEEFDESFYQELILTLASRL